MGLFVVIHRDSHAELSLLTDFVIKQPQLFLIFQAQHFVGVFIKLHCLVF